MDRTERFYRIDRLLNERKTVTLAEFMRELGVSRATFLRDLAYMRDRLHAPIEWDAGSRGYRLSADASAARRYALPGLWFNATEIHALLAMQHLIREIDPGLLGAQIEALARRLERMLDEGRFPAVEIARRIRLVPVARRPVQSPFFEVVASAVLSRRRLRITHHNRYTDATLTREVSPQRLVYYRDNWYLDAWCHLRNDLRSFAMDALQAAIALPEAAVEIPEPELAQRFDAGYGIFSGNNLEWAKLRFSPYRARWVASERWHPDQRSQFDGEGRLLLEVPFLDPRELVMDILRHGAHCEVLAPAELRAAVSAEANAIAGLYSKDG